MMNMDLRKKQIRDYMGKPVHVIVDRPIGYEHKGMVYPVNYGYIPGLMAGDGEEQDAYILGIHDPVSQFDGQVVAVVVRENDCEDKFVVAPAGTCYTEEQIREAVHFQEQFFHTTIELRGEKPSHGQGESKGKVRRKRRFPLFCLAVIATALLLCAMVIYFAQPFLFFYPYHDEEAYTVLEQSDDFVEVSIPHGEGRLHGWLHLDGETEIAPLVILYGGNGQNSSAWFRYFENANTFQWFRGYHVLFVDYPGYGLSDGKPTEKSLFAAALEIFDYAETVDEVNGGITLLGYSIGTGVATYVASRRQVDGLILLAPYDRGLSLYNDTFNIFHGPLKALARFKFDSAAYAQEIEVSSLIIASYDDEVIPYTHAIELGNYFQNVDDLLVLEGIRHDGFLYSTPVLEAIQSYLLSRNMCS